MGLVEDGTASLSGFSISEDGTKVVYGVSYSGSDWKTVFVRDVETKKDMGDEIKWVKFSGLQWNHAGTGFYYCRYPEPASSTAKKEEGINCIHIILYIYIVTIIMRAKMLSPGCC